MDRPVAINNCFDVHSIILHVIVLNCLVLLIFTVDSVDLMLKHSEPNIIKKNI